MHVRWLGWAGVELEADGETLVIDPLADPGATFAALGEGVLRESSSRRWCAPSPREPPLRGLVSHLHRDHTDAGALAEALSHRMPRSTSQSGPAVRTPRTSPWPRPTRSSSVRLSAPGGWPSLGEAEVGSVHDHGPAGRRRPRRPAGLLAGGGGRTARSCTSATRSSTATGGGWPAGTAPSTWSSRRSTGRRSTSRICSRRARSPPRWSRSRRPSPQSCSARRTVIPIHTAATQSTLVPAGRRSRRPLRAGGLGAALRGPRARAGGEHRGRGVHFDLLGRPGPPHR